TSLAFRAREGLREAYLQAHLAEADADPCRATVARLGRWARGGLSRREQAQVDGHLDACDKGRALAGELQSINTSLRALIGPVILGAAAVGYFATSSAAAAAGLTAAGAAASGSAGGTAGASG